jgi:hypothetical protein
MHHQSPGSNILGIADVNNEITTIHLAAGSTDSYVQIVDNGLTKLDTPTAGKGALVGFGEVINDFDFPGITGSGASPSSFWDSAPNALNFDISGLNGANFVEVVRDGSGNNADVYTLGNFGTNLEAIGKFQALLVSNEPAPGPLPENNSATYNFGSGAYVIVDSFNNGGHTYNDTAANGAALNTLTAADTVAPFAMIQMHNLLPAPATPEFLTFSAATGISSVNVANLGGFGSVLLGAQFAAANLPAHQAGFFDVTAGPFNGDTFVFAHTDTSAAFTANDALVGIVGAHVIAGISATHVIDIA